MRPGTEFAELTWGQIEIKYYPVVTKTGEIERDEETGEEQERIEVNPNITAIIKIQKGKTGERECIGRSPTVSSLRSICHRNYNKSLEEVIKENP